MTDIIQHFEQLFLPQKALVVYKSVAEEQDTYVEAYDMDDNGCLMNAHPLSESECAALALSLASSKQLRTDYLQCRGLIPEKVLYTATGINGFALWYTPPQSVPLHFKEQLGIPCALASVPALVWKAGKDEVGVFAIKGGKKPDENTPLYHAPFFNVYSSGKVCMGTVDVDFEGDYFLETFMAEWENNFFNSYFSHAMTGHVPVKGNIVQLWQGLAGSGKKFPENRLIQTKRTLKNLCR